MKKTLKIILAVFLVLVILIVIGLGIFITYLDSFIEKGVTVFGSKMTGTKVELEDVSVSLLNANVTIKGFSVGNPSGYANPKAFDLTKLHADVNRGTIFSNNIEINEIVIDGAHIDYEPQLTGESNLSDLKKAIQAKSKASKAEPEKKEEKVKESPAQPEEKGEKKTVLIKLFKMTNCKVTVTSKLLQGKNIVVPLPDIELKELGGNKKSTPEEVFEYIYEEVLVEIVKAVSKAPDALPIKDTLNNLEGTTKGAIKEGEKAGKTVIDSIKKLF